MNMRVGSPRPKVQLAQVPVPAKTVEQRAMATVTSNLQPSDVDQFLKARSVVQQRGMLHSISALLDGPAPKSLSEASREVQGQLHAAVNELTEVYKDGLITEPELKTLSAAKNRLDHVAMLFEPAVLDMLPRDVRERLWNNLMPAIDELRGAAGRRERRMVDGIVANLASVQQNPTPEYGMVDVNTLAKSGLSVAGTDRYAPGDMVSVPRSDGSHTLGVVQEVAKDHLVCEFLDISGGIGTKQVSAAALVKANPLKIGDCIDTNGGRLWVTGAGKDGLTGVLDGPQGRKNVDTAWMAQLSASIASHVGALRNPAPTLVAPVVNVAQSQAKSSVQMQVHVMAGGFESTSPTKMKGDTVNGAAFTWRGIGYADYNEDGAVLGVIAKGPGVAHETGFAGAFDQAGGMGHAKQTGAASQIAAKEFADAAKAIAGGLSPEPTLREAVLSAHDNVVALGVGAATTFAAAVVKDGVAHVVNCGDSAVMIFDKNGKLKGQTEAHNLGDIMAKQTKDPNAGLNVANVITSCVGGNEKPQVDYSKFNVEKGDMIVCVSDGVADANLGAQKRDFAAGKPWNELNGDRTTREIGALVAGKDPAAVTQAIIDYAKEHVLDGRGKKDNVTASVLQVG